MEDGPSYHAGFRVTRRPSRGFGIGNLPVRLVARLQRHFEIRRGNAGQSISPACRRSAGRGTYARRRRTAPRRSGGGCAAASSVKRRGSKVSGSGQISGMWCVNSGLTPTPAPAGISKPAELEVADRPARHRGHRRLDPQRLLERHLRQRHVVEPVEGHRRVRREAEARDFVAQLALPVRMRGEFG